MKNRSIIDILILIVIRFLERGMQITLPGFVQLGQVLINVRLSNTKKIPICSHRKNQPQKYYKYLPLSQP